MPERLLRLFIAPVLVDELPLVLLFIESDDELELVPDVVPRVLDPEVPFMLPVLPGDAVVPMLPEVPVVPEVVPVPVVLVPVVPVVPVVLDGVPGDEVLSLDPPGEVAPVVPVALVPVPVVPVPVAPVPVEPLVPVLPDVPPELDWAYATPMLSAAAREAKAARVF